MTSTTATTRTPETAEPGGTEGAVERSSTGRNIGKSALLAVVLLWCLIPFLWLINTSLKQGDEALNDPNPFAGPFGFDNYVSVLQEGFLYNLRNSLIVAGTATAVCIVLGSLAAYALVRLPMKGKIAVLTGVLAVSLFPPVALLPPLYEAWRALGLLNTYPGLWIPYIAFTLPLTIYTLTTFFAAIPADMEEAAKVDGATPLQAFYRVVVPLALPGIVSAAIIVFVFSWNEFLLASAFAPRDLAVQPVSVGIANFTGSVQYQRPIGAVTAGSVIVTIPMIAFVLLFQKRIVSGLTAGGVKG